MQHTREERYATGALLCLAMRFLQFLELVYVRKIPWRLSELARELEVSERTVRRYVDLAALKVTDREGNALIVCEVRAGRSWVVLRKNLLPFEALVR